MRQHARNTYDIWFFVSVPVLSEQMTDAEPRDSTISARFTMTFFFARPLAARPSSDVTVAGRPWGMFATMMPMNEFTRTLMTTDFLILPSSAPLARPMIVSTMAMEMARMPMNCTKRCTSTYIVVFADFSPEARFAIVPIMV